MCSYFIHLFFCWCSKGLYYRYSNHLIFPFNLFPITATYFGEFSWLLSWFQNIFHFSFRESFANPACIILNEQPEIYFYTLWIWNYIIELSWASLLPLWSFIKLSVTTDFFTFIVSYNFNEIYLVSYLCNGITHSSSGHETVRFDKTEVHLKTWLWFYTIRFFQLINFVGFFSFFHFWCKILFSQLTVLVFLIPFWQLFLLLLHVSVTTCGLARDALSLLRERKDGYDIVISDVNMPDMDGFKLLEHVGLEMDLPVISKFFATTHGFLSRMPVFPWLNLVFPCFTWPCFCLFVYL